VPRIYSETEARVYPADRLRLLAVACPETDYSPESQRIQQRSAELDGSVEKIDGSGKMEDGSNCVKGMDSRKTLNDGKD
jgi:hypothetical protein